MEAVVKDGVYPVLHEVLFISKVIEQMDLTGQYEVSLAGNLVLALVDHLFIQR